eukprot:scaffold16560_cov104-Phaeocystis_antarctica.AAC.4
MDCEHRVLDVFVTNADPNLEDDYDDQFICAVQSVRLHVESSDNYAVIVEEETDCRIKNGAFFSFSSSDRFLSFSIFFCRTKTASRISGSYLG